MAKVAVEPHMLSREMLTRICDRALAQVRLVDELVAALAAGNDERVVEAARALVGTEASDD
jgi:hypothetical protein